MFKRNQGTQIDLFDKTNDLNDYHRKLLEKSWAGYFRENIFPKINEDNFSVLFSTKVSRPNTPVNIMVGLLILKELNGQTDDELMNSLIFDTRYQYALYTTSYERQPISRNAFTNFRNHLISYELETGKDLYKEEIIRLSTEINKCCKKGTSLKRMDSMMISSSCKSLSRINLAYKVNINLIEKVNGIDEALLGDREKEYLKTGFKKETVYSATKENQQDKLKELLKDSKDLYDKYKDNSKINILEEFKLLDRMLHEQTDDKTGLPKDSKEIKPDSLQNPSDPDATYRFKYGNNVGYVANVIEEIHENGEVYITDFDVKQNTYSDASFMEDYIEKKEDNEKTHTYLAHFEKSKCENCPLRENCKLAGYIKKSKVSVRFTGESYQKAKLEKRMNTEEYKKISNHRAGIEGTMSTLRRKYNVDNCPSKGLLRLKLKFGGDILSINIKKAIKYSKKGSNEMENISLIEKIILILGKFRLSSHIGKI